jgi:putative spermidine/putrescine transport system substrate-binding protein
MTTQRFWRLAAGVALGAGLASAASAQDSLTVTSWGGAYTKSQEKAFFEPFAKTANVKVLQDEWDGSVAKLKGMVDTKQVTWDVVDVEPGHALQGCDEGWLEKIDYSRIGGKDKFVDGAAMDCAVGTIVFGTIYAYNADKFPNGGPQTMADLWDVKKFPGARALRKSPKTTLEFALIADGVAPKDVYKVLATKDGVDRAFKKLDAIKPHVKVWWSAGAQPPQLLADGEVVMTTAASTMPSRTAARTSRSSGTARRWISTCGPFPRAARSSHLLKSSSRSLSLPMSCRSNPGSSLTVRR